MRARVDDLELYYEQYGEGAPIVFVNGWLDDCSIWNNQSKLFAKRNCVVIYDHRGQGRSDKPKGDYSVRVLSNDLYHLMQELALEKATIVGFSLGGFASLIFALDHPEKVSKLVVVGSTAKMAFLMKVIGILRYVLPYETVARIVCTRKFDKPSKQILEDALGRAMNTSKHAAYESLREFTKNYDIRGEVSKIQVPTLIVVGQEDKLNLEASKFLNKQINGSQLRIVSGCGHTTMIERAEEFNQILEEFVR